MLFFIHLLFCVYILVEGEGKEDERREGNGFVENLHASERRLERLGFSADDHR